VNTTIDFSFVLPTNMAVELHVDCKEGESIGNLVRRIVREHNVPVYLEASLAATATTALNSAVAARKEAFICRLFSLFSFFFFSFLFSNSIRFNSMCQCRRCLKLCQIRECWQNCIIKNGFNTAGYLQRFFLLLSSSSFFLFCLSFLLLLLTFLFLCSTLIADIPHRIPHHGPLVS